MATDKNAAWIEAEELASSPIFDEAFYLATAGISPDRSSRSSARHFLLWGWKKGLSPHPLIDIGYVDTEVRDRWRRGEWNALLKWARSEPARRKPWGPLFDPRTFDTHPISVLSQIEDSDLVPVPPLFACAIPTLAEVRAAILAWHKRYSREFSPKLPPRITDWDHELTSSWISNRTNQHSSDLVSVIMPAKDRADSIHLAVESVLQQSHSELELIIVDDGSTDNTPEIAQKYQSLDSRIRIIKGPHLGVGPARQAALNVARGEYLAFLDSDNTWVPKFLEYSIAEFRSDMVPIATHTGLRMHNGDGVIDFRGGDVSVVDLQVGNSIDINVLVARRSTVQNAGGFDLKLRRWVDYDLVLRLSKLGEIRYLPFIGCDYSNHTRADRITRRESRNWEYVVKAKNLLANAHKIEYRRGRVSAVVLAHGTFLGPRRVISSIIEEEIPDLEIILVDCGSDQRVGRRFQATYAADSRVHYYRLVSNPGYAAAANFGFSRTTGDRVLFIDSTAIPRPGWLRRMLTEQTTMGALGVQATLTQRSGEVLNAGYSILSGHAVSLLSGLTLEDARKADVSDLTAISRYASLFDAQTFAELNGFDPFLADAFEDLDLCLRVHQRFGQEAVFACATDALVSVDLGDHQPANSRQIESKRIFEERWAHQEVPESTRTFDSLSLSVKAVIPGQASASLYHTPLLVRDRASSCRARWAIKIGASYDQDLWGDVPFADDLAQALRAQGQEVVIDRYGAHDRDGGYIDDVVLTIRGRWPIPPRRGKLNIMWVISRPDLVTVDEVLGYDLVYSASEKWAAWMTAQSGKTVRLLHQATSPERFKPDLEPFHPSDDLLFVGAPRPSEGGPYGRRLVGLAVESKVALGVWGRGWENFVPREYVREGFLEFDSTPRAYCSANIALNDHWIDMREWGFISNRAFDIVACGTPVISDNIDGLEIFLGAAVAADTSDRMTALVTDRSWIPSASRMLEISSIVRDEHSFAKRAMVLIEDARAISNRNRT